MPLCVVFLFFFFVFVLFFARPHWFWDFHPTRNNELNCRSLSDKCVVFLSL